MNAADRTISGDERQIIELNSEYLGVTHLQLMEAAGCGIAREVASRARTRANLRIDVFAGPGKNGGDSLSAARHLASQGFHVKVTLVGKSRDVTDLAAKQQLNSILQMKDSIVLEEVQDSSQLRSVQSDLIIDGLLGTGVKGDLRQPVLGAVNMINASKGFKIAVDLPSGLDSDTGEPHGEAVRADLTITLHRKKLGLLKNPGHTGELIVLSIGIPLEAETYAGPGDFSTIWRPRPSASHKGDFGRLLIIGGSENFTGAPAFSALAATKCGTDLVYVASPEPTANIVASYSPDLITIRLNGDHLKPSEVNELERWLKLADAVVLGPGIGLHEDTKEFVWKIIALAETLNKPLVLDADALKIFAEKKRRLKTIAVMTPHQGEFAVVAGEKIGDNLESRVESAEQLAVEVGSTIILKGHVDITTDGKHTKLNRTGNPYMTVGGTGDVLTGILGGFLAQNIHSFKASAAAAFLNGLAGDMLIAENGPAISPSSLVEYIPKAMKYCLEGPPYPSIRK